MIPELAEIAPFWRAAGGFALGAIVGSFLATAAIRWPAGEGALGGRSACDGCGRRLRAWELLPLLSYAMLRGRCARCGAAIDPRHPAIELAAGGIGALSLLAHPDPGGLAGALFGWALLLLALLDAEHLWLPDRVTLPLIALGLTAGFVDAPPTLAERAIGAAAGFLSLAAIAWGYRAVRKRTGLGGGDPKLFAAIGAWLGWTMLPFVLLAASLIGFAALASAGLRGERADARTELPLGAFLAIAAWPIWLAREPLAGILGF